MKMLAFSRSPDQARALQASSQLHPVDLFAQPPHALGVPQPCHAPKQRTRRETRARRRRAERREAEPPQAKLFPVRSLEMEWRGASVWSNKVSRVGDVLLASERHQASRQFHATSAFLSGTEGSPGRAHGCWRGGRLRTGAACSLTVPARSGCSVKQVAACSAACCGGEGA